MAQWVEHLLCKYEDLSLNPRAHEWVHVCKCSALSVRWGTESGEQESHPGKQEQQRMRSNRSQTRWRWRQSKKNIQQMDVYSWLQTGHGHVAWRNRSYEGSPSWGIESAVVELPNLGAQLVFILIELCFPCTGLFRLEIYCNKVTLCISVHWTLLTTQNSHYCTCFCLMDQSSKNSLHCPKTNGTLEEKLWLLPKTVWLGDFFS